MWFTRHEKPALERAKRRARSSRASVFLEFALIMPLVLMLSSALIELAGFWDSQIMANHAAWQVGRIAMVRGDDGMHFDNGLSKKSKTGIVSTNMPDVIRQALQPWNNVAGGMDKFNDRAVLTTVFLMMTCEMGYYGATPGTDISKLFKNLFTEPIKSLVAAIPELLKEKINFDKWESQDPTGIAGIISNAIKKVIDKIFEAVLNPLADKLVAKLNELFDKLSVKIDDAMKGDGAWALLGREFYGALKRVGSEKDVKNIVKVEELEKDPYIFSRYKPLAYPEIVDKTNASGKGDEKVKSSKGWPPNNNKLGMIHVQVSWPYSRGWMFPVVSGYGKSSDAKVVRATGHSLVLPQPDICNANLMSTGATSYAEGSYTNLTVETFKDLLNDMTDFIKKIQYTYKYRIREESVSVFCHHSHKSTTPYWGFQPAWDWLFNPYNGKSNYYKYRSVGSDTHEVNDLYRKNWKSLTNNADFDEWKNGKGYGQDCFKSDVYHNKDWMYWPDPNTLNWRYPHEYIYKSTWPGYLNKDSDHEKDRIYYTQSRIIGCTQVDKSSGHFVSIVDGDEAAEKYKKKLEYVRGQVSDIAKYYHDGIRSLIVKEIADMDSLLAGDVGDIGSGIIPSDTKEFINNPQEAQKKAREKWNNMHRDVMQAWNEVNAAVRDLRGEISTCENAFNKWSQSANTANSQLDTLFQSFVNDNKNRGDFKELIKDETQIRLYASLHSLITQRPDLMGDLENLSSALAAFQSRLKRCYEKEVALGRLIGLKSAKDAPSELDPADIPGRSEDIKPVPEGSIQSGSDDDGLGDKWKWQNGAWK